MKELPSPSMEASTSVIQPGVLSSGALPSGRVKRSLPEDEASSSKQAKIMRGDAEERNSLPKAKALVKKPEAEIGNRGAFKVTPAWVSANMWTKKYGLDSSVLRKLVSAVEDNLAQQKQKIEKSLAALE